MASTSSKSSAEKIATEPDQIDTGPAPAQAEETSKAAKVTGAEPAAATKLDARAELDSLKSQIGSLSIKQSTRLITFENNLNRAKKFIDSTDEALLEVAESLRQTLHCLLYTSPSPRDRSLSRMPSSA